MIRTAIVRGLAAGLTAGVLAGIFALLLAEPSIDAAIALEEAAAAGEPAAKEHADEGGGIGRTAQKAGLVVGTALYGVAVGAVFGAAMAWAVGRLAGDDWTRALKLGAAGIGAVILLPALKYPPNPPAVGDPATVGGRTSLYLTLVVIGIALMMAAWAATRRLVAGGMARPVAHTVVGAGMLAAVTAILWVLPEHAAAGGFPADLLWAFRLSAIGTQIVLLGGTAVVHGLLSDRAQRRAADPVRAPA